MAKQIDSKNQIWFEQNENVVKVGFTKSFLEGLDQCWHILPANLSKFRSKSPLLTVETNDSLISIMSPVSGNFFHYSDKAQNFPDRLTEEDVVLEIGTGAAVRPEVPRAVAPQMEWAGQDIRQRIQVEQARMVQMNDVPQGFQFNAQVGEAPLVVPPRRPRGF